MRIKGLRIDFLIRLRIFLLTLVIILSSSACHKSKEPSGSDTTSHSFVWTADTIGTYFSSLRDVWGTDVNNVYAVGYIVLSDSPYTYTAIMHWDGTQWTSSNYQDGTLDGIYGFSANDIWVVGEVPLAGSPYELISHWDGRKWNSTEFNQYGPLTKIWGTNSSSVNAVGLGGLILYYDGHSWNQQQSGTSLDLRSVWGIDDSHVYAVVTRITVMGSCFNQMASLGKLLPSE